MTDVTDVRRAPCPRSRSRPPRFSTTITRPSSASLVSSSRCPCRPAGAGAAVVMWPANARVSRHQQDPPTNRVSHLHDAHKQAYLSHHTTHSTWPYDTLCGVGRPWWRWPARPGREVRRARRWRWYVRKEGWKGGRTPSHVSESEDRITHGPSYIHIHPHNA